MRVRLFPMFDPSRNFMRKHEPTLRKNRGQKNRGQTLVCFDDGKEVKPLIQREKPLQAGAALASHRRVWSMKLILALVLIGVPALHAMHVVSIQTGYVPLASTDRPLSWSSLDRIAGSGDVGKSAVLGIDALLIAAGIKLLIGRNSRRPKSPKR